MPMTAQGKDYYFKFRSLFYLREADVAGEFRPIGLVDTGTLTFNETVDRLKDVRRSSGGSASVDREIESGELALTMREGTPENFAIGWLATQAAVASGAVTAQAHTVAGGDYVYVGHTDISNVVVTGTGGTPTYVLNTDYTVNESGIFIVPGGALNTSTAIEIDFDYGAQDTLALLSAAAKTWEVVATAQNKVQGGAPSVLQLFRVRFGPTQSFAIQGAAEHGSAPTTGEVLNHPTKGWGQWRNRSIA